MIFVSRLLHFGRSDISGVTYTREAVEEMVARWKLQERPTLGVLGQNPNDQPMTIDLTKVTSKIVDMYVDDEGLVVHQEILETPHGIVLKELLEDEPPVGNIVVKPNMTGKLDNGYTATDLKLISVRFEYDIKD